MGFGLSPTHHHELAGMRNNILLAKPIDFALTSTNMTTTSFTVGRDVGSDHRPITLTIDVH